MTEERAIKLPPEIMIRQMDLIGVVQYILYSKVQKKWNEIYYPIINVVNCPFNVKVACCSSRDGGRERERGRERGTFKVII